MPKLIAANWKENPKSEKRALDLFRAVSETKAKDVEVAVCPPFIYVERIAELHKHKKAKHITLGAQDAFWEEKGPYTSEVGPKMLRSLGIRYVVLGHSERRKWMNETDRMINKKVRLVLEDKLVPILCVGEALAVRRKGRAAAERFVKGQLKKDLKGAAGDIVVAYEPIWAIGTGRRDKPEDAVLMVAFIKKVARGLLRRAPRVLYGGSVNGANVADYVQYKGIDGALVGGASLKAGEFKKIIKNTGDASSK